MIDQEKIAALEARIAEMTTMPSEHGVVDAMTRLRTNAWRWNEKIQQYEDCREDALIVERALTATRARVEALERVAEAAKAVANQGAFYHRADKRRKP